ncbi:MAG: hypothetical protein ABIF11_01905 [Nitrospirota bacterium]
MVPLALDLNLSAELLNIETALLKEKVEKREIEGIKMGNDYRISVFILSKLLKITPERLLNFIEDFLLSQKIKDVEKDEFYEPVKGRKIYQRFLKDVAD